MKAARKYLNDLINNSNRVASIDTGRIDQIKEIIEMMCYHEDAEWRGCCTNDCDAACEPMKFIIRHMLLSCKEGYVDPTNCEIFKDMLYDNVLGDFE